MCVSARKRAAKCVCIPSMEMNVDHKSEATATTCGADYKMPTENEASSQF